MAKTGIKSKAYYNTGTYGTPVWVELVLVSDLDVHGDWKAGDGTDREAVVVIEERTTLNLSVTGTFKVKDADTAYIAFDNCFHDSTTTVDVMVLNGANSTNGVTGFRFDAGVHKWGESQAKDKVLFKDFELKPSMTNGNKPKRVVVTSGSPVFTDLN